VVGHDGGLVVHQVPGVAAIDPIGPAMLSSRERSP